MALEVGTITNSMLSSHTFNTAVQNNVKTIALFDNKEDVINLNTQFFEKTENGNKNDIHYRTSIYHNSVPLDGIKFASDVLIKNFDRYNELIEKLKIDGSS